MSGLGQRERGPGREVAFGGRASGAQVATGELGPRLCLVPGARAREAAGRSAACPGPARCRSSPRARPTSPTCASRTPAASMPASANEVASSSRVAGPSASRCSSAGRAAAMRSSSTPTWRFMYAISCLTQVEVAASTIARSAARTKCHVGRRVCVRDELACVVGSYDVRLAGYHRAPLGQGPAPRKQVLRLAGHDEVGKDSSGGVVRRSSQPQRNESPPRQRVDGLHVSSVHLPPVCLDSRERPR